MRNLRYLALAALLFFALQPRALAQGEFGFVNTRPSGQPYLTPEESLKRLRVPPGWEVKLFAAEPDIINPISFTVDERGRLWVVECFEYPKRTPPGKKPRDRIKILEDTTGAGRADKVTLWAEGKDLPRFDLASGIEVGHGGVFLGAAPYLLFLRDHGSGHCDQYEILLRGFGSQDTHETLNTLQWGPDGLLYGLHGIFTQSKVGDVQLNAAVWRYDAARKKFGIFAEGTSNPWGLDFDAHGQAFLAACVIPHFFHIIPGGTYIRQAGGSQNPYAYGLLREISDHLHHQESGWAHAGVLVLQGDHIPPELQDSVLMGSIHGCSIKRDVLARRGSTFIAHHRPDFLVSGDKNFRPINMRWGPDGSIYVIDWHDQNPCHQAQPDSWDMTHGRIYRIQRTGTIPSPPINLAEKSSRELVELLKNNSPWWYRTSLRLLGERRDRSVVPILEELMLTSKDDSHSLRGIWGLYAVGAFDETSATRTLRHASPWVRAWTVRLLGEAGQVSDNMLERLSRLAKDEEAAEVRLQLASTAQRLTHQDALPLLHALMRHSEDGHDPCIPLMIWLAYEPHVLAQQQTVLAWLKEHASGNLLVTDEIVPRVMRRSLAMDNLQAVAVCVGFLGDAKDSAVRRRALEGILQAMGNRLADPPARWKEVFASLLNDPDPAVKHLARRLAVKLKDQESFHYSLALARDRKQPLTERIAAIRDVVAAHPVAVLGPLEDLFASDPSVELRSEVCRALSAYENPEIAGRVLAGWKGYPPELRVEAVNLLVGRREWAHKLLAAVAQKEVSRTDLNDHSILRIRALHDRKLNEQIEAVWGRVRENSPAELNLLIERMRAALDEGRGSMVRGKKVFEEQCAKCHRFEGKGHDVGPNLDGAARDIDYLLVNVLDPNRVVGQPYYTRFVVLKNGRVETGLLAGEDGQSVTLKNENDALKVISRKDIEEITVQEKSLMPEGLNKNMTPQHFRDLIRYLMANPYLTDVAVAGPFVSTQATAVNVKAPLQSKGVTWTWPVVGPSGRISLPKPGHKGESLAFIAAEVTAPVKLRTRLFLGSHSPLQVWLNGAVIYKGTPAKVQASPDQAAVDVELHEGLNHILFQVNYWSSDDKLYARLMDAQRKLRYSETQDQTK